MPFFSSEPDRDAWLRRYDAPVRFWIVLDRNNRYGPANIGVTAHSILDACEIIETHVDVLRPYMERKYALTVSAGTECISEIDLNLLDPEEVLPFIGRTDVEGIWWPDLKNVKG